jgi:D-alanine-D-alanine ligase
MSLQAQPVWAEQLTTPVAVLLGGNSAEREVSLQSGAAIVAALQKLGIAVEAIDTAEPGWLQRVENNFAHVFIALHGAEGENGTVQGALQMLGVSYTGSGVMASALAMDKLRTKLLWQGMGFPTPAFVRLSADSDWESIIKHWGEAIVKPASEGSSIGMSRVSSAAELKAAYEQAARYDSNVIAEQWISGAEFTVAVLGDSALPVIRLETDNSFYDYEAKYLSEQTRYLCPCGLDAEAEQHLQKLALHAFNSLGCKTWGRVDFMQDSQGDFYALEVNTVPGMTSHSLVPMAAKAAGLEFDQLVARILALSLNG